MTHKLSLVNYGNLVNYGKLWRYELIKTLDPVLFKLHGTFTKTQQCFGHIGS